VIGHLIDEALRVLLEVIEDGDEEALPLEDLQVPLQRSGIATVLEQCRLATQCVTEGHRTDAVFAGVEI
jgi:hypothetical protein